jgi:hypothetical protein
MVSIGSFVQTRERERGAKHRENLCSESRSYYHYKNCRCTHCTANVSWHHTTLVQRSATGSQRFTAERLSRWLCQL